MTEGDTTGARGAGRNDGDASTMDNPPPARPFLAGLLRDMLHSFGVLLLAFAIGTGATGIVCWYYGLPLVLALGGGLLVLGFAVFIKTADGLG